MPAFGLSGHTAYMQVKCPHPLFWYHFLRVRIIGTERFGVLVFLFVGGFVLE